MAQENEAGEGKAGGKKSRKWLLIGVALAVLLLGGGGAAAFFLLGGQDEAAEEAAEPVKAKALYTKVRTPEGKPMFVVTLPSEDGRRHYMQAYVEAVSRDPEVVETLTLHMPRLVAQLNALFGSKSFEVLRTIEGKRQLRADATELLQGFMQEKIGRPGVETILFTNFVMQ